MATCEGCGRMRVKSPALRDTTPAKAPAVRARSVIVPSSSIMP
jgi:hypothetical protein